MCMPVYVCVYVCEEGVCVCLCMCVCVSRVCSATGCKKSTQTLSQTCPHCRLKFCFTHGQAEAHGCGDAARDAAREEWRAGHTPSAGAKALGGWQRNVVKTQLHKKIEESVAKRSTAKEDAKSKKK